MLAVAPSEKTRLRPGTGEGTWDLRGFSSQVWVGLLWEAKTEVGVRWCSECSPFGVWADVFWSYNFHDSCLSHLSYITVSSNSKNCLYAISQRLLIISCSHTFSPVRLFIWNNSWPQMYPLNFYFWGPTLVYLLLNHWDAGCHSGVRLQVLLSFRTENWLSRIMV